VRPLAAIALVLALAAPASAQSTAERVLYGVSIGGVAVTTVADHESTEAAIATGRFAEGNPILRTEDGGYNAPLKFAISGATMTATHVLLWRRGRHRWAIAANLFLATAQGVAAYNNRRQVRLTLAPAPPRAAVRVGFRF
jgi:hypothetical protein